MSVSVKNVCISTSLLSCLFACICLTLLSDVMVLGMIGAGITQAFFGLAYYFDVHSEVYFSIFYIVNALAQATGTSQYCFVRFCSL